MPYEGPGLYEHYKGGQYVVLGLGLKEDTVKKPGQPEHDNSGPEVVCVIYMPVSPGSLLYHRDEKFWLREHSDFDANVEVEGEQRPRFSLVTTYTTAQASQPAQPADTEFFGG